MKPDNKHLARNTDPETSKAAAKSLSMSLTVDHYAMLAILKGIQIPRTDDQIADAAVRYGNFVRHEHARRALRTLRERTDYIQPAIGDDGKQIKLTNDSGRQAHAWVLSKAGYECMSPTKRGK